MLYRIVFLLAILFLVSFPVAGQAKETTKVVIPSAGSEDAKYITKQEIVTDSAGKRIRVVNYLTPQFAKERGFKIQIDEYDPKGFPARFVMISTSEYESVTGFAKRIDYVDEHDNLLTADFYIGETFAFGASKDDLDAFDRYPPHRMGRYVEDYHTQTPKENEYTIEVPIFGGTTYAIYLNSIRDIGPHEKYLIQGWSKSHSAEQFIPVYNKEVLVQEAGKQIWVCFQDELLKFLASDLKMVLRYYYIGESNEGITFLVTFMKEVHPSPPDATRLSADFENVLRITRR